MVIRSWYSVVDLSAPLVGETNLLHQGYIGLLLSDSSVTRACSRKVGRIHMMSTVIDEGVHMDSGTQESQSLSPSYLLMTRPLVHSLSNGGLMCVSQCPLQGGYEF